jgi:protein-S-isoprenylcysteine O-methyltransferase Ste14
MADPLEKPNSIPWPPLIYGGLAIVAVILQAYFPLAKWATGSRVVTLLGTAIFLCGLTLDIGTLLMFARRRANFLPHRSATALITTGPFRLSRNPIYLGNTLALAGAGIAFRSLWLLAAAALAAILTHYLAILREERHLAAKFGAEWQAYAARTPRWIGWSGSDYYR